MIPQVVTVLLTKAAPAISFTVRKIHLAFASACELITNLLAGFPILVNLFIILSTHYLFSIYRASLKSMKVFITKLIYSH